VLPGARYVDLGQLPKAAAEEPKAPLRPNRQMMRDHLRARDSQGRRVGSFLQVRRSKAKGGRHARLTLGLSARAGYPVTYQRNTRTGATRLGLG
jgi:hypothetical protein